MKPAFPLQGYFAEKFGVDAGILERLISAALARGGNYSDVYLEEKHRDVLVLEEGILRSATKNVSQGVGIRVVSGERTGYAYAEGFEPTSMLRAAETAARIATGVSASSTVSARLVETPLRDLYPGVTPLVDLALPSRIALLHEADRTGRAFDPRIVEVRAVLASENKHILVFNSRDGGVEDVQPLTTFQASCIAEENGRRQVGVRGGGGRVGMGFFATRPAAWFATEAARQAMVLLSARPAPAGPMPVVLGPGWPGILLHEAVGHGLEADFVRKNLSAFAGRMGQPVASGLCTVVDDGTIPGRRGSLNVDDEGTPSGRTVLIENGILRACMQDRLSAALAGTSPTGNGRRESYAFIPMPRMTNTFMLPGASTPEEIIRSVRRGVYAVHFGGGQVDITNGKFVFSASEAYLIEEGRITAPLRGATLVGSGPEILTRVSMVGNDLALDEGIGTCGKDGQNVPVGVGAPTMRVDEITVGGTGD